MERWHRLQSVMVFVATAIPRSGSVTKPRRVAALRGYFAVERSEAEFDQNFLRAITD
jgi:hypothetical protein